ncbi:MAG: rhomboid family intramembrane serine protease [Pseudooceanicola sp.]|nr:rhomboid family intramembrane serine protease [Pseudooceanicola sp.]
MFPIRDHNPSGRRPYVVYTLVAANVLCFLGYLGLMGDDRALWLFFSEWGIVPRLVSKGQGYHGLFTSLFLHAGFMHLAGNMLFLWIFGDNLEDEMGHLGFLLFYLASGIGAGLVHVLTGPDSPVPTVGASGAIAGVMGGYLLLFPKAKVDVLVIFIIFFRVFAIRAWIVLAFWFGVQFLGSIGSDPNDGGIAYWAHTGGFVIGLVLTLPVWLRRGATGFWNRTDGHPPHPDAHYAFARSSVPKVPKR